jgi:hypothetical protein
MKIKRFLAIILCLSLLVISVIGCGNNEDDEYLYENGNDAVPSGTPAPPPDAGSPLEEAEEILRLLNEQVGSDNFIEFFREMMFEHSEDEGGVFMFPDGYLFREGDMVSEFYEATASLEIGEVSGIVETMYGYHIILRLPIDYDSAPIPPPGSGQLPPLRQLAAMEDYRVQSSQWVDAVSREIKYSPEFEALDIAAVFENGISFEASFSNFAPDTIMIWSGDFTISWAHIYAFIFPLVDNIFDYHEADDSEIDWHDNVPFEDITWEELVLRYAEDEAILFMSYQYGMKVNNVVLSDDDLELLDELIEQILMFYGSLEEFETVLRENDGYYNFELFIEFAKVIELGYSALITALYGEDGADFPDERVAEYAEANGFLMAMHILRMKPEL